jgi:hypothetical protein
VGCACSEGHGTAGLRLRETGRIDNRIDNESATPPVVDSAAREQRACVAISPPFSALAVHVGRTLHGEEREVSTTKRQRIDNCL